MKGVDCYNLLLFEKVGEIKGTCNYANTEFFILFCILDGVTDKLILTHSSLTILGYQWIWLIIIYPVINASQKYLISPRERDTN